MWPAIEHWSWIAGIVGAVAGVLTLVQAKHDRQRTVGTVGLAVVFGIITAPLQVQDIRTNRLMAAVRLS